jgi:DNA ligase 1
MLGICICIALSVSSNLSQEGFPMKFLEVAHVFDLIETESSRTEITKQLASLFSKASPKELEILCNLSLGILRPSYEGTQFNFAEKSMIAGIARFFSITEDSVKKEKRKVGDLGSVVGSYQWKAAEGLTLQKVYDTLCHIENLAGTGSQEEKVTSVVTLLSDLDPISAKYVVRIILGALRLGFSDMTIIDALSWMVTGDKSLHERIEQGYNHCADLGLVAMTLASEGIIAVDSMEPRLGIPIRPAAAERMPTAEAIFKKLGPCIAQPKLDGFRLQIHIDNRDAQSKIHFFSRNLIDMSAMFPDLVAALTSLKVETLICEGEAIVVDPNTGCFLPFQETVKRKRKHNIEEAVSDFPLRVYIFDILYLNGQSLLFLPHTERRTMLEHLFSGYKDERIQVLEEVSITSTKQLEQYFSQNISAGLEGIVVKKPDSIYEAGKRNFNWIKFKRHEEGELEDTVDCVILGYYSGKGKRASLGIGAFLVGIYNKEADRFETVAKIGTGLSDDAWKELKKKLDKLAVVTQSQNIVCAPQLVPDVWVAPQVVVIIRADEITRSPLHAAGKTEQELGYALRFPRFMGYSEDKTPFDATTIDEIRTLYKDQFAGTKKRE